ncbi:MAG: PqqD family protein [Terracidiphilus sp.]
MSDRISGYQSNSITIKAILITLGAKSVFISHAGKGKACIFPSTHRVRIVPVAAGFSGNICSNSCPNPGQIDEVDMQVERTQAGALVENLLPDGSRVILDSTNETVYALNATAGAAWDACNGPTTLSRVTEEMRRSLNPAVTEELAEEAIQQLQSKKLVAASGLPALTTRREMFATLGAIAVPLVVSLTLGEQRAYAGSTVSAIKCPTTSATAVCAVK